MFVSLINLFFVPTLSVYLYCRRENAPLTPSLELLFRYCIAVSFNFAVSKFLSLIPQYALGAEFSFDSAHYTVVALFSAWLLPKLYSLAREIRIELHVTGASKKGGGRPAESERRGEESER